MSTTHTSSTFHRTVVEDVIRNMRAEFANEGLDDQVLDDLKQVSYLMNNITKITLYTT